MSVLTPAGARVPSGAPAPGIPDGGGTELLICCARARMNAETADRIRTLLRQETDWTHLLQAADWHGLTPLVYWHLSGSAPDAVPKAVMDHLRARFHEIAGRNLFQTAKLLELLDLFAISGIVAIPYKGPALASLAYGNLALREFVDLDFLVRERDVPKAQRILISQGYRPELPLGPSQEAAFREYHYHSTFLNDADGVIVELHWRVAPRYFAFALDVERLWERLKPMSLVGKEVLTLSPEDWLLILCAHGAKHRWEQLKWICDIAELIRVQEALDWGLVTEQAMSLGVARMLFLGLVLARDLLGAALPGEVVRRARADPVVESLAAQIRAQLFSKPEIPSTLGEMSLFHLRARERFRDRLRYCLRLAVTPTVGDWQFVPLPRPFFPLYYLLRPIRLAADSLRRRKAAHSHRQR